MKLINIKEVTEKLSCSRSHIYKLMKKNAFPSSYGTTTKRWREDEVDAYIILLTAGCDETSEQLDLLKLDADKVKQIKKMVNNSKNITTKHAAQSVQRERLGV